MSDSSALDPRDIPDIHADCRARLVALEREREEDRQAIRALTEACDQMLGENSDCTSLRVLRPYVAAIQRAQERP